MVQNVQNNKQWLAEQMSKSIMQTGEQESVKLVLSIKESAEAPQWVTKQFSKIRFVRVHI